MYKGLLSVAFVGVCCPNQHDGSIGEAGDL